MIVGDRMTEKGRGGGDLVETFELYEITSLPTSAHPGLPGVGKGPEPRMRPGCPAALSAP
jgi:hypothetical protein